jgi:hypothetical protein
VTTLDEIRARYLDLNGDHPMTAADEEYVRELFVPLEDDADVQDLIVERRLPLPSYLLSDGTPMVHPGYLESLRAAGGADRIEDWFLAHWPETEQDAATEEWDAYLSGQYVCLYQVVPETIQAKTRLIEQIKALVARVDAGDADARSPLRAAVDELDALEPPFAPHYDRLRFGGPLSRDVWIDEVREQYFGVAQETG